MTWDSVDLPEPFGPMMACTSPRFTVSESAWRISRSSTRTCRFLTSSSGIHSVLNLFDQFEALLDARRHMLAYRRHFNSHRLHLIHEPTDLPTNGAQLFQHEIFWLNHQSAHTPLQADRDQLLRLDRELHRQLLQHVLHKTIDHEADGLFLRQPALHAIEQHIL